MNARTPWIPLLLLAPTLAWAQPAPAADHSAAARPSIAPLVARVRSSVVSVTVREKANADEPGGSLFGFGGADPDQAQPQRGLGSGVILDASGLVLTNDHVVQGAQTIRVGLDDGRVLDGKVLGADPQTDIALVQLQGDLHDLPAAPPLGDSDALRVGDYVVAIGDPFGLSLTVTLGIVSAKERQIGSSAYDDFIQTDAAINPGNSGGPLFNLEGQVVGLNTAIVAGGQGIGFAVPINLVRALLPQLERGKVVRGYMGVVIQDLTPELAQGLHLGAKASGALVATVAPGGPAAKAGLQVGDVIVGLDGEPVDGAARLSRRIAVAAPGTRATLSVDRAGRRLQQHIVLGTQPHPPEPAAAAPKVAKGPSQIGVALQDASAQEAQQLGLPPVRAVVVVRVDPGSPADQAGLRAGDALLDVGRTPVTDAHQATSMLNAAKRKRQVVIRVQRGEAAQFLSLTVPR